MITISDEYKAMMLAARRHILVEVNVDWNNDGTYSNETFFLRKVTIERSFEEPLGGFSSAICDIELINFNQRYTPTQ